MNIPKKIDELCFRITGLCMKVHRELGPRYPEEYYQKALEYEFTKNQIPFEPQKAVEVIMKR
jgi:GxxExxY protein